MTMTRQFLVNYRSSTYYTKNFRSN